MPPTNRSQFTKSIDDIFGLEEEDEESDDKERNEEKNGKEEE